MEKGCAVRGMGVGVIGGAGSVGTIGVVVGVETAVISEGVEPISIVKTWQAGISNANIKGMNKLRRISIIIAAHEVSGSAINQLLTESSYRDPAGKIYTSYAVQGKVGGVWTGEARPNTPNPPPTA